MEMSDALAQATVKVQTQAQPMKANVLDNGTMLPQVNEVTASFFNLTSPNQKDADKMNAIYEWAKEHTDGSDLNVLDTLRDIRYRLGAGSIGQSQLDKVYTYVTLRRNAARLDTEAKAMEVD